MSRRYAGLCWPAAAVMVVSAAGCASRVLVTPLATGQVSTPAYELRGQDVAVLRQEAARLCGGTADVLRESVFGQQTPEPDGRLQSWWQTAQDLVMQPDRRAQLMVVCQPTLARERLDGVPGANSNCQAESMGSWLLGLFKPKRANVVDKDVPYGF